MQTRPNKNHSTHPSDPDQPLVSFIIAAYNEERFITDCVDSCLNQTYPNIEVCVTDDGSEDNTWGRLKANYGDNSRVKLARFSQNKGKVEANNASFKMSAGRYIATISGDDAALTERIEISLNFMKEKRANLVFGKRLFCNEDLDPIPFLQRKVNPRIMTLEGILFTNFCYGPTLFFSREIAEKCFPIPEILLFEDWWIGFIAILYGKIDFLDQYVTKYRQHPNNDVSNINETKRIESMKKDFRRHDSYYQCFMETITAAKGLKNKEKLKKLVLLNRCYRHLFLEDSLFRRLRFLSTVVKNATIDPLLLYTFWLLLAGNRIYFVKRLALYKRLALETRIE